MKFNIIKEIILQVLFPRTCVVCDKVLCLPSKWYKMLCSNDEVPVKDIRSIYVCEECQKLPGVCNGSIELKKDIKGTALMSHDENAKKMIYGLKFHDRRVNAQFIGFEMAVRLGRTLPKEAYLVPVPLHKSKRRKRGFNQAELIAIHLAYWYRRLYKEELYTDTEYLYRCEDTKPLKELRAKERKKNIKGVFCIDDKAKEHQQIVLVDDICTSGATINECASTIRKASKAQISFICASAVD